MATQLYDIEEIIDRAGLGRFQRRLLAIWERMVLQIPLVSSIYRTAKEIVETFGEDRKQVFRQVVLVQFPRPGCWAVGFLVGEAGELMKGATGRELLKVLVPHVPVPMSGFLLFVPREEVIFLNISVEEGLRLVVSTGIIEPNSRWPQVQNTGKR